MLKEIQKHKIEIAGSEEYFICREDQHLLAGMASMGKKGIPSGCHGGGCGVCKILIAKGKVETKVMSSEHVSEGEKEKGYSLACRSFPLTDIQLKVIGKISKNILRPVTKKYGFV